MAPVVSATLTAPGADTVVISKWEGGTGLSLDGVDMGAPVIRDSVENRPNADGTIDSTAFIGARVITLSISAPAAGVLAQSVLRYGAPALRSTLTITGLSGYLDLPIQATVRSAGIATITSPEDHRRNRVRFVAQFVVPTGILEGISLQEKAVYPSSTAAVSGVTFDLAFDWSFGVTVGVIGAISILVGGTAAVWPVINIYGPCTNPKLTNLNTGRILGFTGLNIAAGNYLEINTANRTIRYNGLAADPRYSSVDWAISSWWPLQPGINSVVFDPLTSSPPSQAVFSWRDAYI